MLKSTDAVYQKYRLVVKELLQEVTMFRSSIQVFLKHPESDVFLQFIHKLTVADMSVLDQLKVFFPQMLKNLKKITLQNQKILGKSKFLQKFIVIPNFDAYSSPDECYRMIEALSPVASHKDTNLQTLLVQELIKEDQTAKATYPQRRSELARKISSINSMIDNCLQR